MCKGLITINNKRGFHLSSATKIEEVAKKATGKVFIKYNDKTADASDMFEILSLGVCYKDCVEIEAEDINDKEVVNKIIQLIENKFFENE